MTRPDEQRDGPVQAPAAPSAGIEIEITGYCHLDKPRIAALIAGGRARDLVALGGNYVIAARRGEATWIATSAYGAVSQFYHHGHDARGQARFHHAARVGDVVRSAGLDWAWDFQALGDLFCLEHLTGEASLHAEVRRTPAGSLLQWDGTKLDLWIADRADLHREAASAVTGMSGRTMADHLVRLFTEELARFDGVGAVLSASGGFDSRLLLAGQLAGGGRPDLVVMGQPGSTDGEVAEAIGRRFALPVRAIDLTAEDYVEAARHVPLATNGTKPLGHWHTYIYTRKAGLAQDAHFLVGSNGETVRSFFYDQGIKARLADLRPAGTATERYWQDNLRADVTAADLAAMPPQLAAEFSDLAKRASRYSALGARDGSDATGGPAESMLGRLDRFYLDQRVRHFIGNGLTLYGLNSNWRTPFLSIPWVAVAERLPRGWKLGSNWHRHAIHRLCPDLLDFPEDRVAGHMARRAPLFYWHWRRRRRPLVPYVDYRRLIANPTVLALLADHASAIDDLLPRESVFRLIDQFRAGQRGFRSLSIFTSLAIWRWDSRA